LAPVIVVETVSKEIGSDLLTSMSKIKWGIACSLSTLAAAATWRLDPISGAAGE